MNNVIQFKQKEAEDYDLKVALIFCFSTGSVKESYSLSQPIVSLVEGLGIEVRHLSLSHVDKAAPPNPPSKELEYIHLRSLDGNTFFLIGSGTDESIEIADAMLNSSNGTETDRFIDGYSEYVRFLP